MKDKLTLNNLKLHKKAKDMEKLQLDEISESQMALETTSSVPTSCEQPLYVTY